MNGFADRRLTNLATEPCATKSSIRKKTFIRKIVGGQSQASNSQAAKSYGGQVPFPSLAQNKNPALQLRVRGLELLGDYFFGFTRCPIKAVGQKLFDLATTKCGFRIRLVTDELPHQIQKPTN